jgi:hypothetical protein
MHGIFTKARNEANESSGISAVSGDTYAESEWFSNACKHLLPTKAGTALHYTSGFDERSCQRYAAGQVTASMHFLRKLLRSPQGWTWLCATMDGSDAEWWREVRYAYEFIIVVEAKRGELRGKYESTSGTAHASQRSPGG